MAPKADAEMTEGLSMEALQAGARKREMEFSAKKRARIEATQGSPAGAHPLQGKMSVSLLWLNIACIADVAPCHCPAGHAPPLLCQEWL